MKDFSLERRQMIGRDLTPRGIDDPLVLKAMGEVPRERFVPADRIDLAYSDRPLAIEENQTISQPFIVAYMLQKAGPFPLARALEIGTGSGYAAAVLSRLAAQVFTIERCAGLARSARLRLEQLGYSNVQCRRGDGSLGWPEAAPFDVILVSAAAASEVPPALLQQLAVGGRLLCPLGPVHREQRLIRVVRGEGQEFHHLDLGPVQFVPLIEEG